MRCDALSAAEIVRSGRRCTRLAGPPARHSRDGPGHPAGGSSRRHRRQACVRARRCPASADACRDASRARRTGRDLRPGEVGVAVGHVQRCRRRRRLAHRPASAGLPGKAQAGTTNVSSPAIAAAAIESVARAATASDGSIRFMMRLPSIALRALPRTGSPAFRVAADPLAGRRNTGPWPSTSLALGPVMRSLGIRDIACLGHHLAELLGEAVDAFFSVISSPKDQTAPDGAVSLTNGMGSARSRLRTLNVQP